MPTGASPDRPRLYVAGSLALTDPGPAAAGVFIADAAGHVLSHRAYYLGYATAKEAALRAALAGLRLAEQLALGAVVLVVDDRWLAELLRGPERGERDEVAADLLAEVRRLMGQETTVEVVAPTANQARTVALAPLVQWLPERTRRAESLAVRELGEGDWEVASEHEPNLVYRVHLPPADQVGDGEQIRCECPDYQYRRIPCKHLLVVAEAAGGRERLFYPEAGGRIPGGAPETDSNQ